MKKNFAKLKHNGNSNIKSVVRFAAFVLFTKPGAKFLKKFIVKVLRRIIPGFNKKYHDWISAKLNYDRLREEYNTIFPSLNKKPKISIIMPVYNPPVKFLEQAIESVCSQLYENWELCIADDNSPYPHIKELINDFIKKDNRIKAEFRQTNGHISACTNSALELACGNYILFMDHDDLLTANCLFEVVRHINKHPEDKIIYSDEDKIDDNGIYSEPHFKPGWAPDNLLSRNYMGHVIVIEKKLVDELHGLRVGFEGSQDYDLLLRATELTGKIGHIPKVLYHWRIHEDSVAQGSDVKPYAYIAAQKALEEALLRRGTPGEVEFIPHIPGHYRIKYRVKSYGKVSIIIPTKDHATLLKKAIDSIIEITDYPDYEIIVLNNNSTSKDFFELMANYAQHYSNIFRCVDANFPFNFSKLMNVGVSESKGEYVLFLNNDVEVIHGDWITEMVSYAQHKKTGAVGVKLLYPNGKIQHAGVVLGIGGAAYHVFINLYKQDPGYFNYTQILNNYSAVTAACMMCRKSIYEEVEGMDEQLEVEYNDIDFCLKLLTHGYYNVYVPAVEVYHHESATRGHPFQSKKSWEQHEKDYNLFRAKWQNYIDNDPFYNPNLSVEATDFRLNFSA